MKKRFLFLLFLGVFQSTIAYALSMRLVGIEAYMDHQYSEAIPYFVKAISLDPHDETSRYLLAASYCKTGKISQSLSEITPLVQKDAAYYFYKIEMDSDFQVLKGRSDYLSLKSQYPPSYLSEDKTTNEKIYVNQEGLHWLNRGMNTLVSQMPGAIFQAAFINPHYFYYTWSSVRGEGSSFYGISICSRENKKIEELYQGVEPVFNVRVNSLENKKSTLTYQIKNQMNTRELPR
ncbi:MAG: hypothetical protein A3G32_08125 [Deltaproteobacteria bacterium RIFCSPLOWO2_12_FULL_40_28]|nr:MAG: hypothetical protein A3C45_00825 [Deltaproteobacteria bacterium RIFCSPHIGHO2_02_FULL_40_28]OGQ20876.1 MAG: hypothetical protein A3E27_03490 [Deltaproteobacteria bacterium RIFCSPHIGHO2_12_FULL_40_32]OGQ39277.1 MAG: hypothetical protein A3I69_04850 [Deltaproteobacteria bacterium RIFCSPLOWO2_02_FULL_40_36]OGQ54558.1 MAG: hypothetical protein A3G32_08125 [Deltaproteobacteria bacterium RIFCSPLOWO2_12_FULL_40_28]